MNAFKRPNGIFWLSFFFYLIKMKSIELPFMCAWIAWKGMKKSAENRIGYESKKVEKQLNKKNDKIEKKKSKIQQSKYWMQCKLFVLINFLLHGRREMNHQINLCLNTFWQSFDIRSNGVTLFITKTFRKIGRYYEVVRSTCDHSSYNQCEIYDDVNDACSITYSTVLSRADCNYSNFWRWYCIHKMARDILYFDVHQLSTFKRVWNWNITSPNLKKNEREYVWKENVYT